MFNGLEALYLQYKGHIRDSL